MQEIRLVRGAITGAHAKKSAFSCAFVWALNFFSIFTGSEVYHSKRSDVQDPRVRASGTASISTEESKCVFLVDEHSIDRV